MTERTKSNIKLEDGNKKSFMATLVTGDNCPEIVCDGEGKNCPWKTYWHGITFCGPTHNQVLCKMAASDESMTNEEENLEPEDPGINFLEIDKFLNKK